MRGRSNVLPLYVTTHAIPSASSATDSSSARSAAKSARKNWHVRKHAAWPAEADGEGGSNQPQPTRKAYVPAPPASPVVSRSRKSNRSLGSGGRVLSDPPVPRRSNRGHGGRASAIDTRPCR